MSYHNPNLPLIVAYDISNHKKRRRLHKHLKGYGLPLQESVFFCDLNLFQRQKLIQELKQIPLEDDEKLHCFTVNDTQAALLSPSPIQSTSWVA